MHLYDSTPSGNSYKVRLILAQLGVSYQRTEIDVVSSEPRPAEFLAANPTGRVPFLELDDGRTLAESNAILWFLGDGTSMLPDDAYLRAQVLQWLFFEQNLHEPNISVVRYIVALAGNPPHLKPIVDFRTKKGNQALEVMNTYLETHKFFVDERYTIADIALYAYTHIAPEGGFDLAAYGAVCRWLERVGKQPGHVPMVVGESKETA